MMVFALSIKAYRNTRSYLSKQEFYFVISKMLQRKRATFGLIGTIYGGLYKKYRLVVNNLTPISDYISASLIEELLF